MLPYLYKNIKIKQSKMVQPNMIIFIENKKIFYCEIENITTNKK